jgi:hypothetical protein
MSNNYGSNIPKGIVFNFDILNKRCYSGSGSTFSDAVSGTSATAVISGSSTLGIVNGHLRFVPGATTRTAYIPFNSANLNLPRGSEATISIWSYFEDQGSIDHPMVGWETGYSWDGLNGFVVGTGWGTDGTRFAVAGNNPGYSGMENNKWIHWVVTFNSGFTNGLKLYKNTSVIIQGTPASTLTSIGTTNTLNFNIGATNSRGGNWGGYMDIIQIWDRCLGSSEIESLYNIQKNRFGL